MKSGLPLIFKDLNSLELTEKWIGQFETLTLYLFEEAKASEEQIKDVMEIVTPKEYKKGTIAWHLVQKGIKEGKHETKVEVAQIMLGEGMDMELIVKISNLPLQTVLELKAEME